MKASSRHHASASRAGFALVALMGVLATFSSRVMAQNLIPDALNSSTSPRERISVNEGWRFRLGDPAEAAESLLYDVRPEIKESADGRAADAEPEKAAAVERAPEGVLKPWILPTGNAFIKDPRRRHARPQGDPGSNVAFVRADFDDRSWRSVNLPHDWAIEGPFLASGPFGSMGRLKSWGAAWYRRTIDISARDQGKSIFLEVDGAMSYATVWLNGHLVGGWPYGYASWRVDLTPYVIAGGRESACDPDGQPTRVLALVSRQRTVSQCLADQDARDPRGPMGHLRQDTACLEGVGER